MYLPVKNSPFPIKFLYFSLFFTIKNPKKTEKNSPAHRIFLESHLSISQLLLPLPLPLFDFTSKNGDFTSKNGDFTSKWGGATATSGLGSGLGQVLVAFWAVFGCI
jgi:hypothetical protein